MNNNRFEGLENQKKLEESLRCLIYKGLKNHEIKKELGISTQSLIKYLKKFNLIKNSKTKTPIVGDKIEKWIFIEEGRRPTGNKGYTEKYWLCECECGYITKVSPYNVLQGMSCRKCANKKVGESNWTGFGDISGSYWSSIQDSAKKRNKTFNITIEYIWDLFLYQEGKCKLTGLELILPKIGSLKGRKEQTASLDRIDNSIGYEIGNVRWIHKDINYIRRDLSDEEFLELVKNIYLYKIKDKEI